ncbi:MAG: folylpolyglutamate synthase/dihydrofolate synthase family protein [Gemmatimonadota bacterium]|nr:MAG: folylpolyglutamate synthase/dihydrofolate synthase family protein [Gemmatimonadota bacterium]
MEPFDGPGSGLPGGLAPMKLDPQGGDLLAERLFPHLATGVQWGLERMVSFLAATGDPHVGYPILHIGGTNGKGSVASTLASALTHAGHRVGLYTSPHLCSFAERFQLAKAPVGEDELIELAAELQDPIVAHGLTFFEAATALAFHLFARNEVDVVVLEVGLGGRLDATNVARPIITAITNVALDHSEYLGDALPDVAREKAGIIKPGVPFITAEGDAGLVELFRGMCGDAGAPFRALDPTADLAGLEVMEDHTLFRMDTDAWGELELWTPLVGAHQAVNAALAVRVLEGLPEGLRPDRNAVLEGIRSVRWPGRSQIEHIDGQTWLLDVAHNTAGALALSEVMARLPLPRPIVMLTAVLGDKDWRSMLPPLFRLADRAILTQPPSAPEHRRWDPEQAVRVIGSPCPLELEADFGSAMERARIAAGQGTVVVTGSNHTVGDALEFLDWIPFQTIPSTARSQ